MNRFILTLIACVLIVPCSAATITVDDDGPADYSSIQQAINGAWDGDVIVVSPGIYDEQITFNGRRVTVRSERPDDPQVVEATLIQSASNACVIFDFGEGSASILDGFTITSAGHGVHCLGASPTISRNIIRDCGGRGIMGANDAAPTIVGNTLVSNGQEGVYACNGLIEGNTISQNSAGAGNCNGVVADNVISGNGEASGLYFCHGEITGNVIVGNRGLPDGGGIYGCNGVIRNNVIAGNTAVGDGGGVYECLGTIAGNTIVGNRATRNGGGLYACSGTISNNIIAFNEAVTAGGMYGAGQNTYNAFWTNKGGHFGGNAAIGTAAMGLGDVAVNPDFAAEGRWDNNGTPETEDDDIWIDGDYHLKSKAGRWDPQGRRWVVDDQMSRCVDAGKPGADWSAELWPNGARINLGAYGGTRQASMSTSGVGYLADLDLDSQIGPMDLAWFAEKWLVQEDLLAEDLDRSGAVDLNDFILLGTQWRSSPPLPRPPLPNPMTWAIEPYATGPFSMAMVATKATSTDGTGVQYYFEDFDHPNFNSGWITFGANAEPLWEDTELSALSTYRYRVKARNRGNRLETDWSEVASGTTDREDFVAPLPNPMTWETEPYGSSSDTILMVATEAVDVSGVEYQFECTSHPAYSSTWQDSRTYEVTTLTPDHYTFRVRARDKSINQNTTGWSSMVTADLLAPLPDPMEWESKPREVNIGGGTFNYYATMTAVEATDESGGVEYYFDCTTESGFDSGWQTSREYTVLVGRKGQMHRFRVRARDISPSHNRTAWSSEETAN